MRNESPRRAWAREAREINWYSPFFSLFSPKCHNAVVPISSTLHCLHRLLFVFSVLCSCALSDSTAYTLLGRLLVPASLHDKYSLHPRAAPSVLVSSYTFPTRSADEAAHRNASQVPPRNPGHAPPPLLVMPPPLLVTPTSSFGNAPPPLRSRPPSSLLTSLLLSAHVPPRLRSRALSAGSHGRCVLVRCMAVLAWHAKEGGRAAEGDRA
eukprot:2460556-Rhodomonas_salina.1